MTAAVAWELLDVPHAVQALVRPQDHSPTFFAPDLSRDDIAPLEQEAFRVVQEAHPRDGTSRAVVITAEQLVDIPNLAGSLSTDVNTIILSADHIVTDRRYREIVEIIDKKAERNVGYFNLVFTKRDTFSAPYFEEPTRQNRCRRILVKHASTRDTVLCGNVMDLLDAEFGDLDVRRRARFRLGLEDLLRRAPLDWTAAQVVEPTTGLEFYPVPIGNMNWAEHAATLPRYSRDPCAFLLERYSPYLENGLLYSGHLRQSDRQLYDAVRLFCVSSRRYQNVDEFFAANDVLIAADLANPSPEKRTRVSTIIDLSAALAGRKAVLGHVATHGKRGTARRAGRSPLGGFDQN